MDVGANGLIKQFLAKQGIPELNPPPHILPSYPCQTFSYSPNQIHAEREKI
jgi:hypothetical protein